MAPISLPRQAKTLADMGKKHHVRALAERLSQAKYTLADFESFAKARDREFGEKDAAARAAILAALERQLKKRDKSLSATRAMAAVNSKLRTKRRSHAARSRALLQALVDGKARAFLTSKSLFATRPVFHKLDETIRGHTVEDQPNWITQ